MNLRIAISPCPNDTFIFENLFNKKISIEGVNLEFHFLDIEELNNAATLGQFDIIKISCAHLHNVNTQYELLQSGGAMGFGVGPILVKAKNAAINMAEINIAIPGKNTTANFLLNYFYTNLTSNQKKFMLFSDIEKAVLEDTCQMGVLIHEGRFTYQERGLELICDLGALWQERENLPIPLGCIVAKKSLGKNILQKIESAITQSICNYDAKNEPIISAFIKQHAQEMQAEIITQHINLYVNEFSKNIGEKGTIALQKMQSILGSQ